MSKRIVFSTATPNNQGGVIPNDVLDFSRFKKNPIVLSQHDWEADPIGLWTDIRFEGGEWSGVPEFHGLTDASRTKRELFEGGWLKGASIGGETTWALTGRKVVNEDGIAVPEYKKDDKGNRICTKFTVYEISIVTLPSNPDATTINEALAAKMYEAGELTGLITKLSASSIIKNKTMTKITKKEFDKLSAENKVAKIEEIMESTELSSEEKSEEIALLTAKPAKSSLLPEWLKEIISLGGSVSAPTPKGTPDSKQITGSDDLDPALKQAKLKAEEEKAKAKAKAKEKAEKAHEKAVEAAEKATEKVKDLKAKAEKEDATEEDKAAYKAAVEEAEECMKSVEKAEKFKAKVDTDEDEDEEEDEEKASKEKTKNAAFKPQLKTAEQMKTDLKLAAAPTRQARVIGSTGKTFSQLSASKDANDVKLLDKVLTRESSEIAEYSAVLESIMKDGKYKAIVDKTRVMANVSESQMKAYEGNPENRSGLTLAHLAAQLNRGEVEVRDGYNTMKTITTLSSTDTALASPALNTIEWLSLAIFKLFPATSWKNEIPIFGANITGKNTGVIWANIAANPTFYKGNQPSNPANYSYTDTAVSLALVPYWIQPMLWTPLTMHQLRYDQMGTGWAQAFAGWNAFIDDNLIYTLASTVPAGSIVQTSGLGGYQTTPQVFNIAGTTDPNAFYYGSFTGKLTAPVLNDIVSVEQIYNKQNFELANERPTLVTDPTMDALLNKDPETKSLLTRWVNQDGGDFVKFKHTILPTRSRVAIYDPATGQVKDPNGTIPSTAISAALGFIPSQVGIGLGMLDVFMIQDPTSYGYKMSADIRMGITPLRADYSGTSLLTYGAPTTVPTNG